MEEDKKPVPSDRPEHAPDEREHAEERKPATWPPRPAGTSASNEQRSSNWPPPTRPASQPLRAPSDTRERAPEKPDEQTRAYDPIQLKPEEKTAPTPKIPSVGATPPPERKPAVHVTPTPERITPTFGAPAPARPATHERVAPQERPATPARHEVPERPAIQDRPFDRTFTQPARPEPATHDVERADVKAPVPTPASETMPTVAKPFQTPIVPAAPVTIPARTPVPQRPATPAKPVEEKRGVNVRRLRRGRLAIRKIDPWAVLKFSLVFYFCMLLIFLLGMAIIFAALKAFGVIDNLESFFRSLEFDVHLTGGFLFKWFFLVGLAGTLLASFVTMFMAFLYNLIADVVGGIELIVTERE